MTPEIAATFEKIFENPTKLEFSGSIANISPCTWSISV
jgi:hypothetical protein